MIEMMFPGVLPANTQMQIHKYSVFTNTVNDEMSVNPMKCYIFFRKALGARMSEIIFRGGRLIVWNKSTD